MSIFILKNECRKEHLLLFFEMDGKNYRGHNVAKIKKQIEFPIRIHVKHVPHKLIWLKSASKICQSIKNKNQRITAS